MSNLFRNSIFIVCVFATFIVLGMNLWLCRTLEQTFESAHNEAAKAQQIMVAQEYAMQIATLAEHESQRAHELQETLEQIIDQYRKVVQAGDQMSFQLEMQGMALQAQGSYIGQLLEFIKANDLTAPAPDMKTRAVEKEPLNDDNE